MDDGSQTVAGKESESPASACLAATTEPVWGAGAVGYERARLAGRAWRKAVSDRHDRRLHQPAMGAFREARLDRREYEAAVELSGEIRPAAVVLYRQGEPVSDQGKAQT